MSSNAQGSERMTATMWLICGIAAIGFAFDIYELLMLPLIVEPALLELVGVARGSREFGMWVGRLFYIPAVAGGIFGLLGGYLTDRLGRRRVLTFSILLYALAAFAAGYSTTIWMLLVCRCLVFVGVCVEFVAAVAWLAELFPNFERREKVLGYTQAFSSIGGLMVATAFGLCVKYSGSLPAINMPDALNFFGGTVKDPHAPWRYTLMSGIIPAIPLILIRPFLPESPIWAQKRAAGTLKRPSLWAIFSPELRKTTIVTTLMFACAYGAAFGAIQHMPRIIPALPEVKARVAAAVAAATEGQPESEHASITRKARQKAISGTAAHVSKIQEFGGLTGRVILALLAVRILSRQRLLRLFQIPGLLIIPVVFAVLATSTNLTLFKIGMFFAGLVTVAQFSFWGNYLPRVYPVHLRGTGESFAANIGGRLIGTCFAWVTASLAVTNDPSQAATKLAYVAAGVGTAVFVAGFLLSFLLPEPKSQETHD